MHFDQDRLYSLYERLYFEEIQRRDRLNARIPMYVGVIVVVASLQAYLFDQLLPVRVVWHEMTAFVALLVGVCALSVGATFTFLGLSGSSHLHLPTTSDMEKHWKELHDHNLEWSDDPEESTLTDIGDRLFADIVECNAENLLSNNTKSLRMHRASCWLFFAAVSSIVAYAVLKTKAGLF